MPATCEYLHGEILRKQRNCSVSGGSRASYARPGRSVEIEHAGDEFAQGDAEVAPQAPLQGGIILGAAEEVAHQLAEDRAAAQELHHPRRDRASQKRAAIKPPHDARRKFELCGERSLHPRGIFFRAPGGQGPAEQFAGADRVKESFAGQGIDPGDAAAWVDPLTGEGLFYAIRSGELLGRALASGCPEKYPAWVKAAFSTELEFAARIVRRFYRGSFLGSAVTTRMVQFLRRSPVFRQLMSDLFSGTQDYSSLKRRLWGHLGITLSEFISSVLNLDGPARARVPRAGTAGD